MPNVINGSGLTVASQTEVLANLVTAYQGIYGSDIVTTSDSPDGQALNIFTQAVIDLEDILVQIYNSFDPDNAIGVTLDQRIAINGIQRQAGTYTTQYVSMVFSQAVSLYGLDQDSQLVYTVADQAGSQWQLQASINISNGSYPYTTSLLFQSATPGAVFSNVNSITVPVSIVLGVTSVNNPTTYTTLGVNEESDALVKIRRQRSTQQASVGFYNGLLAALGNVPGVTSAFVYENYTSITNVNGVPGHSIWVVVAGSGAASAIAQAIYGARTEGCGMVGAQNYNITQADGTLFTVFWDNVVQEALYIEFTATSIDGVNDPNIALILSQLPIKFVPGVNQTVDITNLGTVVQSIDPNCLVENAGFSTSLGGPYTDILIPTNANFQFAASSAQTIITPVILSPTTVTVPRTRTQQFTPLGGSQTGFSFFFVANHSGGSINAGTGLYTAGSSTGVDTIGFTDSLGNAATAIVTVI